MNVRIIFNAAQRIVAILLVGLFLLVPSAQALSGNDINDVVNKETYFDAQASNACGSDVGGITTAQANRLFFIGDSLTYGMAKVGGLLDKAKAAGYDVGVGYTETAKPAPGLLPRVQGASIDATGGITIGATSAWINSDQSGLGNAGSIIVALGTNGRAETGKGAKATDEETATAQAAAITTLIQNIRSMNIKAKIFWLNTYFTDSSYGNYISINKTIADGATTNNYTVIDIDQAITSGVVPTPNGGDNVHYSPDGYKTRAAWLVSTLGQLIGSAGENSPQASAGYDPLSLTFPSFPDEAKIVTGIEATIKRRKPSSPWLTPGFGQRLMDKTKASNVNPLFIVASGSIESGFGTSAVAIAHNNSFGMKASGSTYRDFPTMEDGIFAFVDVIPNNLSGKGASGAYKNVKNIYEYFSVHQTGGIHYPGDGMNIYDPAMDVYISWDPNANASKPGNPQYNPLIYFKANVAVINEVTGLNIPADVSAIGSLPVQGCTSGGGGSGSVSVSGYSFPLEPQTQAVGGITVGQTVTTHHDGTPAFDLFSKGTQGNVGGDKVYALYGGTVTNIGEEDAGWCYSIQLKADDGYYYWFGHLNHVSVTENSHVMAGQQMAETAQWTPEHTCNGTSGATHLHIDRGCTINGVRQTAGRKECRDPDFIPFLSKLYETLPK